jgi:hypothetical protein
VELVLDLAVVTLGLLVIGSLALLAWTLAVSAVRAIRRERARIANSRMAVAGAERRVRAEAARLSARLDHLAKQIPDGGDRSRP